MTQAKAAEQLEDFWQRHILKHGNGINTRQYAYTCRSDSRFAPSQWETSLLSNAVSHWLVTNLESTLLQVLHEELHQQINAFWETLYQQLTRWLCLSVAQKVLIKEFIKRHFLSDIVNTITEYVSVINTNTHGWYHWSLVLSLCTLSKLW